MSCDPGQQHQLKITGGAQMRVSPADCARVRCPAHLVAGRFNLYGPSPGTPAAGRADGASPSFLCTAMATKRRCRFCRRCSAESNGVPRNHIFDQFWRRSAGAPTRSGTPASKTKHRPRTSAVDFGEAVVESKRRARYRRVALMTIRRRRFRFASYQDRAVVLAVFEPMRYCQHYRPYRIDSTHQQRVQRPWCNSCAG